MGTKKHRFAEGQNALFDSILGQTQRCSIFSAKSSCSFLFVQIEDSNKSPEMLTSLKFLKNDNVELGATQKFVNLVE